MQRPSTSWSPGVAAPALRGGWTHSEVCAQQLMRLGVCAVSAAGGGGGAFQNQPQLLLEPDLTCIWGTALSDFTGSYTHARARATHTHTRPLPSFTRPPSAPQYPRSSVQPFRPLQCDPSSSLLPPSLDLLQSNGMPRVQFTGTRRSTSLRTAIRRWGHPRPPRRWPQRCNAPVPTRPPHFLIRRSHSDGPEGRGRRRRRKCPSAPPAGRRGRHPLEAPPPPPPLWRIVLSQPHLPVTNGVPTGLSPPDLAFQSPSPPLPFTRILLGRGS